MSSSPMVQFFCLTLEYQELQVRASLSECWAMFDFTKTDINWREKMSNNVHPLENYENNFIIIFKNF